MRKVLRSDYQAAWVEILEKYRRVQADARWTGENWLDALSGPIRLKALKILSSHPGRYERHWDAAIAALALCCKAKDADVILRFVEMQLLQREELSIIEDGCNALERIVRWEPEKEFPLIFDFVARWIPQVHIDDLVCLADVLLESTHPRAEEILRDAADHATEMNGRLPLEFRLYLMDEARYLERAQQVVAQYKDTVAAYPPGYLERYHYHNANAIERLMGFIDEFLNPEEEDENPGPQPEVIQFDDAQVERLVLRLRELPTMPEPLQKLISDMVLIEGGTFNLQEDKYADPEEDGYPPSPITLSDYCIGKFPVTQAQWQAVMGGNPSAREKCEDCPVENVSWLDTQLFCHVLQLFTGQHYRLPTSAEWEFAAIGGKRKRATYEYAGSNDIDLVAWHKENSNNKTHPVGEKAPNRLGLYDMSGNVQEWCWDFYDHRYFLVRPLRDPRGPDVGYNHVMRGGSFFSATYYCHISLETSSDAKSRSWDVGFRLVREVDAE